MKETVNQPAVLLLEDGSFYQGFAAGITGTAGGEICFNTGMTGYQEIFTDPSYHGQALVATNVHIGNYGTKDSDNESDHVQIKGLICKHFNKEYSRQMADSSIQDYFEKEGIVCIHGIDTRSIVRHIRDKGAMNCIISSEIFDREALKKRLKALPQMEGLELASRVSTEKIYSQGNPEANYKVAVLDLGVKRSILKCLEKAGCLLKVFPAKTSFEEIKSWGPNGYFLSNGPGDPSVMDYAVQTVKDILHAGAPLFGICLGHQVMARALGIPTYKMHHGHRGINHPVKNLLTGSCEITSQNHGFCVDGESLVNNTEVELTYTNLNDGTVEGMQFVNAPAFSVQFHPEASPGPHDSRHLFEKFIQLMQTTDTGVQVLETKKSNE